MVKRGLKVQKVSPEVDEEWRATVMRHVRLAVEEKQGKHRITRVEGAPKPRPPREGAPQRLPLDAQGAEMAAVRELRKHLLWYTRGRRGGVTFRKLAPTLCTVADVQAALDRIFPADGSVPHEVRDEPAPVAMSADD